MNRIILIGLTLTFLVASNARAGVKVLAEAKHKGDCPV